MPSFKQVEFTKQGDNLRIDLLPAGRAELNELIKDNGEDALSPDQAFFDLIEWQRCNGWTSIGPEEVGALTGAPMIADDVARHDNGKIVAMSHVYAYMAYQVFSPARELFRYGWIVLQGSPVNVRTDMS